MVDESALRKAIQVSGLKQYKIAKLMGLSTYGLFKKITGITEFKGSEIVKICEILNLDNKQRENIFFGQDVD